MKSLFFEKWKEEKIFLFIMVTVGFLIMYLTPPMCTPDENTHFANAVSVGYGNIFPDVSDGELGRYMSKEIVEFINYNLSKYSGKLEEKCTFKENYFASWLPSTENELVFRKMSAINPLCYAVAALGIRIGSVFCRFL